MTKPAKRDEHGVKGTTKTLDSALVDVADGGTEPLHVSGGWLQFFEERQQLGTALTEELCRRCRPLRRVLDFCDGRRNQFVLLFRRELSQVIGFDAKRVQCRLRLLALLINAEQIDLQPPERRTHRVDARAATACRLVEHLHELKRRAEFVGRVAQLLDAVIQVRQPTHDRRGRSPKRRHASSRNRERVDEARKCRADAREASRQAAREHTRQPLACTGQTGDPPGDVTQRAGQRRKDARKFVELQGLLPGSVRRAFKRLPCLASRRVVGLLRDAASLQLGIKFRERVFIPLRRRDVLLCDLGRTLQGFRLGFRSHLHVVELLGELLGRDGASLASRDERLQRAGSLLLGTVSSLARARELVEDARDLVRLFTQLAQRLRHRVELQARRVGVDFQCE